MTWPIHSRKSCPTLMTCEGGVVKPTTRKPKLLALARDAGAANALAPVVRMLLDEDRTIVRVIGFRHAVGVFRQFEQPLWACPDDGTTPGVAAQVLDGER